jgi:hypothetical protein
VNGSLTAHADCVAQIEELVTRAAERLLKLEVPLENGSVTNELWQLGPVHFRRELVSPSLPGRLWRVSRPRVSATDYEPVSEPIIKAWVRRVVDEVLPGEARGVIDYVCLLDGEELALFYGAQDASAYGALLSSHARGRAVFDVHHFPMQDGAPEPPSQVTAAAERTRALLASGASVVLGCAAAAVRTGAVLGELGEATSCVAEAVLHQR